jgi:hypothetical protein
LSRSGWRRCWSFSRFPSSSSEGAGAENRIVYRTEGLELEHIAIDNFAAIAMPIEYAILGRDFMNRYRIQLDGPGLRLTIE